jgi:hypothetical protein
VGDAVPNRFISRPLIRSLSVSLALAAMLAAVAWGGHELPVYPSYYPHEIAIETVPPERAVGLLAGSRIQAYIGAEPRFAGDLPASLRTVESLGGFVIVRLNSAAASDSASACAALDATVRGMAGQSGFVFHPYPVTPFHGDYLFHADRAAAANARYRNAPAGSSTPSGLRIKAEGAASSLVPSGAAAAGPEWDVAIEAIPAADLVAGVMTSVDGWLGPPWLKAGWFHAARMLGGALDEADVKGRADALVARLEASEYRDAVERINLERELVEILAGSCRERVAGYTVKREYFSAEFTDGVENIGFDSIAGLNSPMFVRTVKLKDFPWNGWLALGIDKAPAAAWNPIAGFDDPFGRLLWSAVGDPALMPSPYDSGWMLNRISDAQSSGVR